MTEQPAVSGFNLVDEPWILVQRLDDSVEALSIRDVFEQADQIKQLLGDLPTQVFAINRLLLAIVHRAVIVKADCWRLWWHNHRLPLNEIHDYLDQWHDRFDLLDPTAPFYQVAGLHTAKGEFTELNRLIGDAPVGHPFLTTRAGASLDSLTFAEAARWLVHCHAFDVSGIKSGAVGDDRVKGGKGYPIGVGAAGQLGGVLLEGRDHVETLLLNLCDPGSGDDAAAWERETPYGPETIHREIEGLPYQPTGPAETFTWQTRRIRLVSDDQAIREVLICNGDRFSPVNLVEVEPMTAWRSSPVQAKKLALPAASMPRQHVPGREAWRGLGALLSADASNSKVRPPLTHSWVADRTDEGTIDAAYVPRARSIGIEYVNNASIVGEIVDDELELPVRVLQRDRSDLRQTVLRAVADTDTAVQHYVRFASNLVRAAGGETDVRDDARRAAYGRLNRPFRSWLFELRRPDIGPLDASDAWTATARRALLALADRAVRDAGPNAWSGREVDSHHLTAPRAEAWFRRALFTTFPFTDKEQSA